MDWQARIFAYCERGASTAFWAEPLNAASNAAFILAAAIGLNLWLRQPDRQRRLVELALVALVFVIGTGSFLFHTYATRWAALADTLPITVFMLIYLFYALVRYLSVGLLAAGFSFLVFFAALAVTGTVRCEGGACLNGSVGYVPALVALGLVGALLAVRRQPAAGAVLLGAGVFLVSLGLRTVDRSLCPLTLVSGRLVGTHFAWHVLNATLLFILLRAAIRHGRAGGRDVKLAADSPG